jgi:hypothetical protein
MCIIGPTETERSTVEMRRASSSKLNISLLFFSSYRGVVDAAAGLIRPCMPRLDRTGDTVVMMWAKDNN